MNKSQPIRGFIFACTDKSEAECFERSLFGTSKVYAPIVIRVRNGDLLFLNNIESNVMHGVFKAISDGKLNIQSEAWGGRYPYQVRVKVLGERISIANAKKTLKEFNLRRNNPLYGKKLLNFVDVFTQPTLLDISGKTAKNKTNQLLAEEKSQIQRRITEVDIEDEIPIIEATTLWDFTTQSYGITPKGDNKYPGVTPALIIYNLIWRYTDPGDLVVDPMCGSGTTIDVCKAEKRRAIGYDIAPPSERPDIIQNDARKIPLESNTVDMVFIDSPYGDNIRYNEHPDCIGKISSETEEFYDELEKVMKESHRILKNGKVLGWLIGDQWVKKRFTPVGFEVYERLCKYFETVDVICVPRRGQASHTGLWYNRARRLNFFLRGFKYLFIMRKAKKRRTSRKPRTVEWRFYDRGGKSKEAPHRSAKSLANSSTDKTSSRES